MMAINHDTCDTCNPPKDWCYDCGEEAANCYCDERDDHEDH